MFELKLQSHVIDGTKPMTKGVLHYFLEQSYKDHTWTSVAYNVLLKYIEDTQPLVIIPDFNNPYSHKKTPNTIRIQCNVYPSIGVEKEIFDSVYEFEIYRGNIKIEEVGFYTVFLNTNVKSAQDAHKFILKGLMQQGALAGNKKKMTLFAVVPKGEEWKIGVITEEVVNRVLRFSGTSIGIQSTIYEERKDILDLIESY